MFPRVHRRNRRLGCFGVVSAAESIAAAAIRRPSGCRGQMAAAHAARQAAAEACGHADARDVHVVHRGRGRGARTAVRVL